MDKESQNTRLTATVPRPLYEQILLVAGRDGWGTLAGFIAHLIRLGFNAYCEGGNKVFVNLKMGKDSEP